MAAEGTVDESASRYELLTKIASGGMATVYVGRLRAAAGVFRLVAIKRAHAHLVENPVFKRMLVDEAQLAARLHHPNVVAVLDVEDLGGELRLVMDYVEGASLADMMARSHDAERRLPARVALRVALDACAGLHAAHELCDEDGKLIGLVHRDVSPHNILVGLDGVGRLSDFGIAKQAEGGVSTTTGALKGKLGYMAPEYVEEGRLDARSDVFALGVVVWEALAGQKLFRGTSEVDTLKRIVATKVPPLSSVAPWVGVRLDDVLACALARSPDDRFGNAQAFAVALETAARKDDLIASAAEVGACVRELCGAALDKRRAQIRERTAPIRHEPTVRITKAPEPIIEAPSASEAVPAEQPLPPDLPREASSITLGQSTATVDTAASLPTTSWKLPVAIAVAALAAGAIGGVVLRGGGAPTRSGASASATIASAAAPIPTSDSGSTTSTVAPREAASAAPSARAPASAGARPAKAKPSAAAPTSAPSAAPEAPRIDPNPYGNR
jgi:serine/threonine-protein kinase